MLSGLINVGESSVAIASIRTDGGTQPREGLDAKYIEDLVEALTNGATLPPVDLMYDGDRYWLYDGFHRLAAHKAVNRVTIAARVHQGDQAAAQWESYAANQSHGLRRSQADKERAIRAALKHPQGVKLANSLIAKHLGVSDNTVRKYRDEMESASQIAKVTERQGADGKTYNTANIGANRPAAQSPGRRYESGLPALNMPSPRPAIGAQPKMPITDWELSDICETVAGEVFGAIGRSRVKGHTDAMILDVANQDGAYWEKLKRTLVPFDATIERVQAAVADAAKRMIAERCGVSTMTPEAKRLGREIKAATWGDKPQTVETLSTSDMQVMQAVPVAVDDRPLPDWANEAPSLTVEAIVALLRPIATEFYDDGSDVWHGTAKRDIRLNAASAGEGAFWRRCIKAFTAERLPIMPRTRSLLQDALFALADEIAASAPVPVAPPVPVVVPVVVLPDERVARATRLIGIYNMAISTFDEYGQVVGAHTETLVAKRALQRLVAHLERECARKVPDVWIEND